MQSHKCGKRKTVATRQELGILHGNHPTSSVKKADMKLEKSYIILDWNVKYVFYSKLICAPIFCRLSIILNSPHIFLSKQINKLINKDHYYSIINFVTIWPKFF